MRAASFAAALQYAGIGDSFGVHTGR